MLKRYFSESNQFSLEDFKRDRKIMQLEALFMDIIYSIFGKITFDGVSNITWSYNLSSGSLDGWCRFTYDSLAEDFEYHIEDAVKKISFKTNIKGFKVTNRDQRYSTVEVKIGL